MTTPIRDRARSTPVNLSLDHIDTQSHGTRPSYSPDSLPDDNEISTSFRSAFGSIDISTQNLDFSISMPTSPTEASGRLSAVILINTYKHLIIYVRFNHNILFNVLYI